ncbi:MAG: DUF4166 domain-containing protein [Leifsonia sp.]
MASPYRAVLGPAFAELHPRLQTYFDAIPAGSVGRGSGEFDTVGTPRRWLWPVLALFAPAHVLFPVWQKRVPFTVENRPVERGDGSPAVAAERVFALRGRTVTMIDEIGVEDGALVDRLGRPVLTIARFAASVRDGGLRLGSTAVWIVVAGRRVRIPRPFAPVVVLTERWDDEAESQRVSITVTAPVIGRMYQYGGRFQYGIEAATNRSNEQKGERSP